MSWFSKIALGSIVAGLAVLGLHTLFSPDHLFFVAGGLLLIVIGGGLIALRIGLDF